DARVFAEEIRACLVSGIGAPARQPAAGARIHPVAEDRLASWTPPPALDLTDPAFEARLSAHAAQRRGADLAQRALDALAERLDAVRQAVLRCEGEAAACADPLRNAALGRAVRAAREAGAA